MQVWVWYFLINEAFVLNLICMSCISCYSTTSAFFYPHHSDSEESIDTLLKVPACKLIKRLTWLFSRRTQLFSREKFIVQARQQHIPGNHQSLWQASPRLEFIPSFWLFIASCKAALSHFQCIGQSGKAFELWADWDKGVRRIIAWIDRRRHPVSVMSHRWLPGGRGQSFWDHWVAAAWQILYTSSQLRWCLLKCKGRARLADSAGIHKVEWTGGNHTQTHTHIPTEMLHVFVGVWCFQKVHQVVYSLTSNEAGNMRITGYRNRLSACKDVEDLKMQ